MVTEEFFDIVDENNKSLGFTKSRKEVHSTMQYWHRATHTWIINNNNQVLCGQRSLSKDVHPGKWQSFFGGHLRAGQNYIDNAIEELYQELGLSIKADKLIPIHILKSDKAKHFGQIFILRWNGEIENLQFKDNEVVSVKWMTFNELSMQIKQDIFCNNIDQEVEMFINKK
ncbi:NUDIX domain-containing protein [Candidatus Azambacteria bacterium]|nr:NUDIX domain-containing protein [Candidatus Azambacteria bacterium]